MKSFGIAKFRSLLLAGTLTVVIEFLMGFSDSVVAGNMLGEQALAGVNLLMPVMTAVTFFAGLVGVGMSVNYSLAQGRLETIRAHEVFSQALWTVLIGGSVIAAALLALREPYLAFMGASPGIAAYARSYWAWYVPVALLEPLVVLCVNANYADGDSKRCIVTYLVQFVTNIGVSVVCVRGGMGLGGCAFGTVVANVVALALLSTHFISKGNSFRVRRRFSLADTWRIVSVSFGDASSFLCNAVLFFFLNKYAIFRFGPEILPVVGVVIAMLGFLEIFNGVSVALAPVATVYIGEGNTAQVRSLLKDATRCSILEGMLLTVALAIFPSALVRLVGVDDPALAPQAEGAVRIVALGFTFTSLMTLFNSYYLYIDRIRLSVALTVVAGLLAPVTLVLCLGASEGMASGIWWALAASPALALLAFFAFVRIRYGRPAFPLLLSHAREGNTHTFDLELTERGIVEVSRRIGAIPGVPMRASLMAEEVLMVVRERNRGRRVLAEATVETVPARKSVVLTLRDDGEIFDITDTDAAISSLRTFLVASVMERQKAKVNLVTTGFNRNVFRFAMTDDHDGHRSAS